MSPRRSAAFFLVLGLLLCVPAKAFAAKYVVYVVGRSMSYWPNNAFMGHDSTWTDVVPNINGSARLTDATTRATVKSTFSTYCRNGNSCVIACYSAGCNRTLLAIDDLKAAGTPLTGLLWIEATASAAGGTPLADVSTNAGVRLLSRILISGVPSSAPIDQDLGVGTMRGTYGYIQNDAPVPMYHMAGSGDLCNKISLKGWTAVAQIAEGVYQYATGNVGWAVFDIISGIFSLFSPTTVTLCGNGQFPGHEGDGAVPVASAAGYSDANAHYTHCDSPSPSNKYLFRAYEQCPLFSQNHEAMIAPLVQYGSIRMAVPKTATCAQTHGADTTDPAASIVYQDADSPLTYESKPIYLLNVCGNNVWNGEPTQYSTCKGTNGCCSNFSTGNTGGCTCGETLCVQSQYATRSWFTGLSCDGTEYSESPGGTSDEYWSWDGNGMVGEATATVTVSSVRDSNGACLATTHETTWNHSCPEYRRIPWTLQAAHRVYRTNVKGYAADPNVNTWRGYVVSYTNENGYCP